MKSNPRLASLSSYLGVLEKNPLSSSFRFGPTFSLCWLQNCDPLSLLTVSGGCSQLLKAACVQYMAPFTLKAAIVWWVTLWGILHFIMLCFIVLWMLLFFFFNKLKVYGNPVLTKSISTIFSIASAHFTSQCRVLVILALFQTVSLLHILWWSVISDSDANIIIVLGCHKLHSYKKANLTYKCCVCSDCSTNQPISFLSPSSWASYFLGHSSIVIRPINNPTMASKFSNDGKNPKSLTSSSLTILFIMSLTSSKAKHD